MEQEHWGYKEVGYKFRTGTGFITPGELDMFIGASGMRQDIFLRDEAGKAFGAEGRIIPGVFLIPAILFRLLAGIGLVKSGIQLGLNNVRFNIPMSPYVKVFAEGELLSRRVTSKGDRVLVSYSWFLKKEDETVVAQGECT